MFAIILIGIVVALLVAAVLASFVFLDVAFADQASSSSVTQPWRPPLIRGKDLRDWAAQVAKAATNKWLSQPRNKTTAIALATEISQGASYAIAQSQTTLQQQAPNCPSCRQHRIGVTPPEAIAIAESLRKSLPTYQVQQIHDQSTKNATAAIGLDTNQFEQSELTCPLCNDNLCCLIFEARPLHCRSYCQDTDDKNDVTSLESHAASVGNGTEDGLSSGLQSAGLDGTIYELNSALSSALDIPDAAEQWINGNPVFSQCNLCH